MVKVIKSIIISLCILTLISCSSQKFSENQKVRIAYFPNITHSQALVGISKGSFEKALGDKCKVDWKMFNAGPSEIEALFAGEIDIGYIGPIPALNGYIKSNGELQILAGATEGGVVLVSRKDIKINSVKELSGKKIAVPQYGNTQDLFLRNLLNENGLKDTNRGGTVKIMQVDNPDIKTAMDREDIDAALVPEPWGSRLVNEVGANIVSDYNEIWRDGAYSTAVVIARTEFINEHPEIVNEFLLTLVELTDYINNNTSEAKEIINSQIKKLTKKSLAKEVLDSSFKRLKVTYDPQKESVIGCMEILNDTGIVKEKTDINNLFNFEPLNKVLQEQKKPVLTNVR